MTGLGPLPEPDKDQGIFLTAGLLPGHIERRSVRGLALAFGIRMVKKSCSYE
jgi:hypothetical protein